VDSELLGKLGVQTIVCGHRSSVPLVGRDGPSTCEARPAASPMRPTGVADMAASCRAARLRLAASARPGSNTLPTAITPGGSERWPGGRAPPPGLLGCAPVARQ